MSEKLEMEKTYGEKELLANPDLVRIREKKGLLAKEIGDMPFYNLMMDFYNELLKKYSRNELQSYGAFHILIDSGVNFGEMKTDLPGDDSIEKFLDEQLAKIGKKEEKEK